MKHDTQLLRFWRDLNAALSAIGEPAALLGEVVESLGFADADQAALFVATCLRS